MKESYLNMIALVERLHRQFLELVRTELDSLDIHDINNIQALLLFNIGQTELTMGDLIFRGCYLGSNVSYNVKKMAENGYLVQERSTHDRRSVHVRLSPKGLDLYARLDAMHDRHAGYLASTPVDMSALTDAGVTLRRLDRFWIQMVDRSGRHLPPHDSSGHLKG